MPRCGIRPARTADRHDATAHEALRHFVRELAPRVVEELARHVHTVTCVNCGAGIDIRTASACPYCRAAIAVVDTGPAAFCRVVDAIGRVR